MLSDRLKSRLTKDRPMTSITLRIPVDVVESMKTIAPQRGFRIPKALLKSYLSEACAVTSSSSLPPRTPGWSKRSSAMAFPRADRAGRTRSGRRLTRAVSAHRLARARPHCRLHYFALNPRHS